MHETDVLEIQSRVDGILNRWPAVGLAVGVVRDGALESFSGHGVANIESATPVTEDTVFRIGSITKTFTAVAVMQLQEQGLIDLDAPANDYLRGFRLMPANENWRPATVRHLLTHTAGVPEWLHPSSVRRGQLILRTVSPIPALYRGLQLQPDATEDPYVFRVDLFKYGLGAVRVVFSRDAAGMTTGIHFDGLLLSADKHAGWPLGPRYARRWT